MTFGGIADRTNRDGSGHLSLAGGSDEYQRRDREAMALNAKIIETMRKITLIQPR